MQTSLLDAELKTLEQRLQEFATLYTALQQENQALKEQQRALAVERASLIEKNEIARTKVAQMIQRLKSMETQP